ncbi:MAG TPA: hypothetical protein VN030_01460 [Cellvibrio sp.]|nr:hypothetical protein [Cellvibrio sp.]
MRLFLSVTLKKLTKDFTPVATVPKSFSRSVNATLMTEAFWSAVNVNVPATFKVPTWLILPFAVKLKSPEILLAPNLTAGKLKRETVFADVIEITPSKILPLSINSTFPEPTLKLLVPLIVSCGPLFAVAF